MLRAHRVPGYSSRTEGGRPGVSGRGGECPAPTQTQPGKEAEAHAQRLHERAAGPARQWQHLGETPASLASWRGGGRCRGTCGLLAHISKSLKGFLVRAGSHPGPATCLHGLPWAC